MNTLTQNHLWEETRASVTSCLFLLLMSLPPSQEVHKQEDGDRQNSPTKERGMEEECPLRRGGGGAAGVRDGGGGGLPRVGGSEVREGLPCVL